MSVENLKSIIEERGWTQSQIMDEAGKCCITGAWGVQQGYTEEELKDVDIDDHIYMEFRNSNEAKLFVDCGIRKLYDEDYREYHYYAKPEPYDINDSLSDVSQLYEILDCAIEKEKNIDG